TADFSLGSGRCLFYGLHFDTLPLAIELVELRSDDHGLMLIVQRQEARAQSRVSNAAAGIDARADQETEMIRIERARGAGCEREGGEARFFAAPRHFQPPQYESAVETDKRHHIANGGERDE